MDSRDGRWLEAAGIVLVRQRPGSAKGVMFITLEDERGIANLVLWPKVFERFYRGQAARAGNAPGVGLDLALTQEIVRARGGRIEAFNAPGPGATFALRLPRVASAAAGEL